MSKIDELSVNAIRILSADAIQKANSGHPGICLGAAPMAYELWGKHMNHNPKNPNWDNRDRFILSAGHGSMLLYSLLHLYGYGNLSIEDLKQFRQVGSLTAGHPEYGHTVGVEATTGPLGQGLGMAVGMALAEAHLAATFNREGYNVVDHHTFAIAGDGCMMEGISSEALSLAGSLKLSKLVVLYDDNDVCIEGNTDNVFAEDVAARVASFGFQVIDVADGTDLEAIGKAIEEAKADTEHPSFIRIHTTIGFGSDKAGSSASHGAPLGEESIAAMRKTLGWPSDTAFEVPAEVYDNYKALAENGAKAEEAWNALFAEYAAKFPELAKKYDDYKKGYDLSDYFNSDEYYAMPEKSEATRASSGTVLNMLKAHMPNLIGGSADLAPSNKTDMKGAGDFGRDNYAGQNLHFGVREQAMTAICNGISLHGGLRIYEGTFFVFSDYTKPMARLSSLMKQPVIYVFTHDSIGVGEDGPTHEPIEQLAMFRALPNFVSFRPCDRKETAAAWEYAIESKETPVALVLTRQNLVQQPNSGKQALKGGYILEDSTKEVPDAILIASGSEVNLAVEAKKELAKEGKDVRVVSMPSTDLFDMQSAEYKESVLPSAVRKRLAVEALAEDTWYKYVGLDGKIIGMKTFGASGPYSELFTKFGFTTEHVVEVARSLFD